MKKYPTAIIVVLILFSAYLFVTVRGLQKKISLVESHLGGEEKILCSKRDVIESVEDNIVRVVGGEGEGSGVMIDKYGTIITNFHVIQFEPSPKIVFSDYSFEPAEIVFADKEQDIAILELKNPDDSIKGFINGFSPLRTGNQQHLKPLDTVFAFGFPWGTDLAGGVTVQQGGFVNIRSIEGVEYIQTDISLVSGQSGGALTDSCGNIIGINTSGVAGLGLAISANTITNIESNLDEAVDPLKDVAKIEFKPHESPLEAVKAFYNYQKVRKLKEAYNLLSVDFLENDTFEKWKENYSEVIDTEMFSVREVDGKDNTVYVKLGSKDLVGEEVVYKYFEGTWEVTQERETWRLWKPDIKQIEEPEWDWFYSYDDE